MLEALINLAVGVATVLGVVLSGLALMYFSAMALVLAGAVVMAVAVGAVTAAAPPEDDEDEGEDLPQARPAVPAARVRRRWRRR